MVVLCMPLTEETKILLIFKSSFSFSGPWNTKLNLNLNRVSISIWIWKPFNNHVWVHFMKKEGTLNISKSSLNLIWIFNNTHWKCCLSGYTKTWVFGVDIEWKELLVSVLHFPSSHNNLNSYINNCIYCQIYCYMGKWVTGSLQVGSYSWTSHNSLRYKNFGCDSGMKHSKL